MLANYLLDAEVASVRGSVRGGLKDLIPDYAVLLRVGSMVPVGDSSQVIVKTHFLPGTEVMQEYRELTGKVVSLVRNPRDVIFSSARMLGIDKAKNDAFAKDFIAQRGVSLWFKKGWGTWQQSVREWTSRASVHQYFPRAEVLTIRYEDMRADPVAALSGIIQFLELGGLSDPDRVERAVRNASLGKMRELEQRDDARIGRAKRSGPLVGKGLTNQSLSALGADVEAAYQQWLRDDEEFRLCVKEFGYED
jgi:hypothetical protein